VPGVATLVSTARTLWPGFTRGRNGSLSRGVATLSIALRAVRSRSLTTLGGGALVVAAWGFCSSDVAAWLVAAWLIAAWLVAAWAVAALAVAAWLVDSSPLTSLVDARLRARERRRPVVALVVVALGAGSLGLHV
jgi:hypothetical protein